MVAVSRLAPTFVATPASPMRRGDGAVGTVGMAPAAPGQRPQAPWRAHSRGDWVAHRLPQGTPQSVRNDLVYGVATPRTKDDQGSSGVFTPQQAVATATRVVSAPAPDRTRLQALLDLYPGTGSTDTWRRALLLKAFGATEARDSSRWHALEAFAVAIGKVGRRTLLERTTLLDIDAGRNSSALDIVTLRSRKPTGDLGQGTRADNDGLLQKHTSSCGPASLEVILGERDPVHAWRVHAQGGPQNLRVGTLSESLQARGLVSSGDIAQLRHGYFEYVNLRETCRRLAEAGRLDKGQGLALLRYARTPGARLTTKAAAALKVVRADGPFPSEEALQRMRQATPGTQAVGTGSADVRRLMRAMFAPMGSVRTAEIWDETGDPAFVARNLPVVIAGIENGGVVLGTSTHWWSMVDVRGSGAARDFLIHDTGTGISRWVPQAELEDGSFSATYFTRKPDRVDSFVILNVGDRPRAAA